MNNSAQKSSRPSRSIEPVFKVLLALTLAGLSCACGGSSSETPMPLEPVPHGGPAVEETPLDAEGASPDSAHQADDPPEPTAPPSIEAPPASPEATPPEAVPAEAVPSGAVPS